MTTMHLPLPKLDENQENYISVINDNIPIYGVQKTVTTEAFNASMALLEASAAEGGRNNYSNLSRNRFEKQVYP